MKLLRKRHSSPSTQVAINSSDDFFMNLQIVPLEERSHKAKWAQHLHMPKLFKSGSDISDSDASVFAVGSPRRRKRDVLRRSLFRKSSHRSEACDSNGPSRPDHDGKESEPEDRSSAETVSSWEEFDVDECEQSASGGSDLDEGINGSFVFPPVVIPLGYRQQDRMGGVTVAGRRVLFTFAAFKRNSLKVSQLRPIAEEVRCDLVRPQAHKKSHTSILRRRFSRRGQSTSTDVHVWV